MRHKDRPNTDSGCALGRRVSNARWEPSVIRGACSFEMAASALTADADVAVLAAALVALQRRVEALERRLAARTLSAADRERLRGLLPAWGGAFGSDAKSAAEIGGADHAGIQIVIGGLSVKALGRLLTRAVSAGPIGGFVLEDAGTERGARLYSLQKVVS
jgi:hypothetical protein